MNYHNKPNMFDESNISQQTHEFNLDKFPSNFKLSVADLLTFDKTNHDQIMVVYYNDYKSSRLFSFEHLCRIVNDITDIPVNKLIAMYRRTGIWDLSEIPEFKLSYIIGKMLMP